MLAVEEPKTSHKFRFSLFIIIIVISIIRIILSYIDKQQIDPIFIVDIAITAALVISMTLNVILAEKISKIFFSLLIGILWLANFAIPFFAYRNHVRRDYFGINLFLIIFRAVALFAYNGISLSIS